MESPEFLAALGTILGRPVPERDADATRLFSHDLFSDGAPVEAVVTPRNAQEVQAIVLLARAEGRHVIARGGGASYTSGYLSDAPHRAVLLDMGAMNAIVEVNGEDMYVLVEAGCTWEALHARLRPMGLRARYWGPMSGQRATVGGAVGQNAIFWGSGEAGSAADTVLGLEVVTGQGAIVRTGSFGMEGSSPFFRHFGPDLTGLFTADAGANGVKTRIALALARAAPVADALAFGLPDDAAVCALLSEIAREGLAAQTMALDGGLKDARLAREGLGADLAHLVGLFRTRPVGQALREAAGVVRSGRAFLDGHVYSAHIFLEARDARDMDARKAAVRAIAARLGAAEVAPSVGRMMLANPFPPLNGVTGPKGERWVPVHCIVPHSRAAQALAAIAAIFARHSAEMERHAVTTGLLLSTVGRNGFVIEPMFLWPDSLSGLAATLIGGKRMARLPTYPDNADARALVARLRHAVAVETDALGAVHLQIGRHYAYASRLAPATAALAADIRALLDPEGVINPGALDRPPAKDLPI